MLTQKRPIQKNRKKWIKIIGVLSAILLIAIIGIIVISIVGIKKADGSPKISSVEGSILEEIQSNSILRYEILNTEGTVEWEDVPQQTKEKIQNKTPSFLGCIAKICDPSDLCVLSEAKMAELGVINKNVYTNSIMISSELQTYEPRIFKLFCWGVVKDSIEDEEWIGSLDLVDPFCGNGQIEGFEDCDGVNLKGKTCQSLGFLSGNLSCSLSCTFDISECVGCISETNEIFCLRHGKNCGLFSATDNCREKRTANCGNCISPKTCGGRGMANVCGVELYEEPEIPDDNQSCQPDCEGKICGASDGCGNNCQEGSGCVLLPAPTNLFALPQGAGSVHLGWRLVSSMSNFGYVIYRATNINGPYMKITQTPIMDQTNYRDNTVSTGTTYYYTVRLVDKEGRESANSRIVSVTASNTITNTYTAFSNAVSQPEDDDNCEVRIGDINGDGLADYLIASSDNGLNRIPHPVRWVKVIAILHNGTRAFEPINTNFRWAGEYPWTLADLNGDGKDEILGIMANHQENTLRLVSLNEQGKLIAQSDPIPHQNDLTRDNRVYMTIARLDGENIYVIVQVGIYPNEYTWTRAYNSELELVWNWARTPTPEASSQGDYNVILAADSPLNYGGSHMILSADLDGDGKDEVIHGGTVMNGWTGPTPNIVWRKAFPHPDGIIPADIRPDIPGMEIFFYIEQGTMTSALVTSTGQTLWNGDSKEWFTCKHCGHTWERAIKHGHAGWCADINSNYPGIECYVAHSTEVPCPICKRYTSKWVYRLWSAAGEEIGNWGMPFPLNWDGGKTMIFKDPPGTGVRYKVYADVIGDYREEIIVLQGGDGGSPLTGQLTIYTNTEMNPYGKKASPWEQHQYVLNQRRTGYQ